MLLAIDPGTNSLGWALFNKHNILLDAGSFSANKSSSRIDRSIVIAAFLDTVKKDHPAISKIALEEPLLRGIANKAMERLLGMIELTFYPVQINYYAPMTIKASMGSGSYDKKDMYDALLAKLGNQPIIHILKNDHDAIDAICIGLTHFKKEGEKNDNANMQLQQAAKQKRHSKSKNTKKAKKSRKCKSNRTRLKRTKRT